MVQNGQCESLCLCNNIDGLCLKRLPNLNKPKVLYKSLHAQSHHPFIIQVFNICTYRHIFSIFFCNILANNIETVSNWNNEKQTEDKNNIDPTHYLFIFLYCENWWLNYFRMICSNRSSNMLCVIMCSIRCKVYLHRRITENTPIHRISNVYVYVGGLYVNVHFLYNYQYGYTSYTLNKSLLQKLSNSDCTVFLLDKLKFSKQVTKLIKIV